eukprot:10895425-Alexandrium_andersonii.AAC.1
MRPSASPFPRLLHPCPEHLCAAQDARGAPGRLHLRASGHPGGVALRPLGAPGWGMRAQRRARVLRPRRASSPSERSATSMWGR